MDWIAILDAGLVGAIAGGLGGALGALLGLLLPERMRKGFGTAVSVFAIACAIGATQALDISILSSGSKSGGLYGPGLTKEKFDAELSRSKEPGTEILRIVREKNPALYRRIRDEVLALTRSGKPREQIINEVRVIFAAEVATRVPRLNDAELEQVLDLTVLEFAHYNEVAPKVCADLLLQRPAGDIRKYMSDEVMEAEIKINEIVFSSKLEGGPTLSAEELQTALEPVYAGVASSHGPEGVQIMMGHVTGIEDSKICSVFLAYFDGIRAMPMPSRVHVWRTLTQLGLSE